MALAKVLARGPITLPKEVRRAADIRSGDTVSITATGPGCVEIRFLTRLTLAETLERYHIDEPIDWEHFEQDWQEIAAREFMDKL